MYTLGISCSGAHESSACLLLDDQIVFATAEERLTRRKQDPSFPAGAIRAALDAGGIGVGDLSAVGLAMPRPMTGVVHDLLGILNGSMPVNRWHLMSPLHYLYQGLREQGGAKEVRRLLGSQKDGRVHHFSHHLCHALSAVRGGEKDEAAVLVLDGRGAKKASSIWRADGGRLTLLEAKAHPDSLGLFYAKVTQYLGFTPLSDEWKVMGLAAYGGSGFSFEPVIQITDDNYRVNGKALLGKGFGDMETLERLLGPARQPGEPLTDRHRDIAWAAQDAMEKAVLAMGRRAVRLSGHQDLCMAGGVALNCKANGLLLERGVAKSLFVQPAAGDDGVAIGAAIAAQEKAGGSGKVQSASHTFLGQETSESEIEATLRTCKIPYRRVDNPAEIGAELLEAGKIIGWFQGRSEFGPRALGNRSILADPRNVEVRDRVNAIVKFREEWRPFAPSVLEEEAGEYFEGCSVAPYMIVTFRVRPEVAPKIAAVVHADGTARVQTVNRKTNPLYWSLIRAFAERTGVPAVLNTSFNLKGEPIVNTIQDAVRTFYSSGLDALVAGNFLVEKEPVPVKGRPDHPAATVQS